jgi:transposase
MSPWRRGIYWKPVWPILDDGEFELVLANAAHVKNGLGRKTNVNDAMWGWPNCWRKV